jgi:hypothetical protein
VSGNKALSPSIEEGLAKCLYLATIFIYESNI